MSQPTHDALIDAIYSCALDPESWDRALVHIRRHLDASAIHLIGLDETPCNNPFIYFANLTHGLQYPNYGRTHDPWVRFAARKHSNGDGAPITAPLLERSELEKTPFCNDWLASQDIKDVLGAILWSPEPDRDRDSEPPRIILYFFRGRGDGCFDEADRRKLEALARHLNRAFHIAIRMGALAQGSRLSETALDALRPAVIVLDAEAYILAANTAGAQIIKRTPELLQVRHGYLIGVTGELSPSLDEAMARGRSGRASQLSWLCQKGGDLSRVVTMRLTPLNENVIPGAPGRGAAFLLIIETGTEIDDLAFQSFCALFRFSRAEQKVLRQLMLGRGKAEAVARELNIALPTVRTHLQSIRVKAGVKRVSELIAMALAATRSV